MSERWINKNDCRLFFQKRLQSIIEPDWLKKQLLFNEQAKAFLRLQRGVWAGFRSLAREVSVDFIGHDDLGLSWVFPRVTEQGLDFCGPVGKFETDDVDQFEKGAWGILEPSKSFLVIDRFIVDGFIVPGVGFNRAGVRIGRGKAYYDRALASTKGLKVGVCMNEQLVEHDLPCDSHDIRMDYIISDLGVIKCE